MTHPMQQVLSEQGYKQREFDEQMSTAKDVSVVGSVLLESSVQHQSVDDAGRCPLYLHVASVSS